MKTYVITKVSADFDWETVPALEIGEANGIPCDTVFAKAQIAYDETRLLVRLSAKELEIRAVEENPYGAAWEDSCLEFFFSPESRRPDYIDIECTPKACLFLGIGSGLQDLLRLIPENEYPIDPVIDFTEDGWRTTYAVPYAFIRRFFPAFSPEKGMEMRANCCKCGDKTAHPHFLTWNPLTNPERTFHFPKDFGKMIFG